MQSSTIKSVIEFIILLVALATTASLLSAIARRIINERRYACLDRWREILRKKSSHILLSDTLPLPNDLSEFSASAGSIKWQAMEDVLCDFMNEKKHREKVKIVFSRLGYAAFYEKRLKSHNTIIRASAVDKLGTMLSESSGDKLADMLNDKSPEVIAVTLRALGKIGSTKGLKNILDQLPDLLEKGFVSRKTVERSLINFGKGAVPLFLEYGKTCKNPEMIASILEVLFHLEAKEALPFAINQLRHTNPEVRARALKCIGTIAIDPTEFDGGQLVPWLHDSVWFVRLQAANALGNIKYKKAPHELGKLLLDEKWQVRNAAATALGKIGEASLDIFLNILRSNDQYAKQSVCEEIEKTGLAYRLIEDLDGPVGTSCKSSKEILKIMAFLKFDSPLGEYLKKGKNDTIKKEISDILNREAAV